MQRLSRKDATALGLKRYYTGAPCTHGHLSPRQTSTYTCIACNRMRAKNRRSEVNNNNLSINRVLTITVHREDVQGVLDMVRDLKLARDLMEPPISPEARDLNERIAAYNAKRAALDTSPLPEHPDDVRERLADSVREHPADSVMEKLIARQLAANVMPPVVGRG